MAGPLAGSAIQDSGGRYVAGPFNSADGTGRVQRARAISGDFAAGEVALYDANGVEVFLAAAMADNVANPTVPKVASHLMLFDGTLWDRALSGDVSNVASAAGIADVLAVGRYNATLPSLTDTRFNALQVGLRGSLQVNLLDKDGTTGVFSAPRLAADDLAFPTAPDVLATLMLRDPSGTLDIARSFGSAGSGGVQKVGLADGSGNGPVYISAAGNDTTDFGAVYRLAVFATSYRFNGSTYDRVRSNLEGTLLASAARTASTITATQTNHTSRGLILFLNITAASGTGGLSVRIETIDPVAGAGAIYQLNASPTAIIATGQYGYELGPGASTAGSATSGYIQQRTAALLPRTWRVTVVHNDASSYTYSLGYALIN